MKTGFTLVELLVVIAIIAILSVVGLVVFTNIQKNARNAKIREDVNSIASAYESNYAAASSYQVLAGTDFAGGKIPVPYPGGTYFVAGPNTDGNNQNFQNFAVCGSLVDNNLCYSNSASCFCKMSSQGSPVDTFSLGNLFPDSWGTCWQATCEPSADYAKDGTTSRKVSVNSGWPNGSNTSTTFTLKADSEYSFSGWIKKDIAFTGTADLFLGGTGLANPGGYYSNTLNMNTAYSEWAQVTGRASTGSSDVTNATIAIQLLNVTADASQKTAYFDAIRVEKVSR